MEQLLTGQHELFGRIARTLENVKKAGAAKLTTSMISTNLKLLNRKWEKFEEHHDQLRSRHYEELRKHDYYLKDFMGQAEEVYAQQRAALLEMELKEENKENKWDCTHLLPPPLLRSTTLLRIQFPHFSGKYKD